MATTDETYGRKNAVRTSRTPRLRRLNTRARASATAIVTGTESAYSAVLRSETQTSGSRTSRGKFSSPTNGLTGPTRLQRGPHRESANATGANEKTAGGSGAGR